MSTNALIQGFGSGQRRITAKTAKEVIAEYTGKKPHRWGRPWVAVAGALALLAAWFWFASSSHVLLSKLHLTRVTPSDTLAFLTRAFPPQETPAMVRDSVPPGSTSTPLLPLEPAKRAAFRPPPEPLAVPQTAPVVVRTIHKGDQIAKMAREVYGVSNPAVLAWIKQNNPHLQNVNRLDVGMHLTFPPLPASSPRKVRGEMRNQ